MVYQSPSLACSMSGRQSHHPVSVGPPPHGLHPPIHLRRPCPGQRLLDNRYSWVEVPPVGLYANRNVMLMDPFPTKILL